MKHAHLNVPCLLATLYRDIKHLNQKAVAFSYLYMPYMWHSSVSGFVIMWAW